MVITAKKQSFEFYLAGVQHHDLKLVIDEMYEETELELELEPTNQYDATAIKVLFRSIEQNGLVMVGYVPGKLSANVTHFINQAVLPTCEVIKLTPEAKPWQQLMVRIDDKGEI